jgi:Fe2+ transport system protein FeoA
MLTTSGYSKNLKSGCVQTPAIMQIKPAADSKIVAHRPQNLYALCDLKRGDVGKVCFIRAESSVLDNIFIMGFAFGVEVTVEAVSGDVLEVNLGNFNLLIGQDVAAKVFVELI